jgi:uncharacterized protein
VPAATELNPFDFSKPASAEELIDRQRELELLVRLAEGNSNSRLTAPRRYGKTTLLKRVRVEAERVGMHTVYVNLYGLLSVSEAADRIENAYRTSLHGAVRNLAVGIIRTFRPTLGIPKTGVKLQPAIEGEIGRRLSWLLDLPVKIMARTGSPTLVVFDEFQDILLTKPPLDGLIRSRLEQHEAEASYIFAGSHPGMMRRLFGDRSRPFYGQARAVRLGPLPDDVLGEYIADRFARSDRNVGDILEPLLATVDGHPQRAMLLSHFLWERTMPHSQSNEVGWQEALRDAHLELRDEFNSTWNGLGDAERRVLAAIARGPGLLMKKSVLDDLHLARSTARDARDRLIDEGHVRGGDEEAEIIDPLFALWVAGGRQGLGNWLDGPEK